MKRKALILFAIIVAVSLSACTSNPASMIDSTETETAASSFLPPEISGTEKTANKADSQSSSFEQVNKPSAAERIASESTEPSLTEAPKEQTALVSQPSAPESRTQPKSPEPQERKTQTEPPVAINPEPSPTPQEPTVSDNPDPRPTAPPATSKPMPTEPAFDVNQYVGYGKNYGQGIGLMLDSSAVSCWDDPISANADCIYLERDIRDRLGWYLASGYTAFWVWSQDVGGGNYLIYIGYA